ncbi:MAG: N-acetyltransferase [Ruminococcus sp.]|nr:N-acetyltransferase [Ruminococcus sp.]
MMDITIESYIIREATADDAAALREIYAYYVENTAVTFEYEPPSEENFKARIAETRSRYPYLLVEHEDEVYGFALAHAFRERPAYDYAAEVTIYIRHDLRHLGLGRIIYTTLEEELGRMGMRIAYACVALPSGEDEYLSMDSPRFHEALGYRRCGEFRSCGYKYGTWYTMIWMEKVIADFVACPEPLKAYPALLKDAAKHVPGPLSMYDDREVRLVTEYGEMFRGVCGSFSAEFGLHEFGKEEEGVQIDNYIFYKSDIRSIEPVG